jgi:hypothetical protein
MCVGLIYSALSGLDNAHIFLAQGLLPCADDYRPFRPGAAR